MTPDFRKLLHICGNILAILGVAFVCVRLRSYIGKLDSLVLTGTSLCCMLLFSLCMGAANLALAQVWRACLSRLNIEVSFAHGGWIYGKTQLNRYIPGNIFHLVGRLALCTAEGLPPKPVTRSLLDELLAMAISGLPFALTTAFARFLPDAHGLTIVTLFAGCCTATIWCIGRLFGPDAGRSILWGVAFLLCMGAVWSGMGYLLMVNNVEAKWLVIGGGAYVAAWLAGLITPGAPAGLGVREAAMLLFMQNSSLPEAGLLMSILLCRVVCVIGDILFFLAALTMEHKARSHT